MGDTISIVTVTYNAEKLLEATIKSVLMQDYANIEYIIVDGKSSDGTMNVINKYSNDIDKFLCEPDKGIYDAMNKAISLASGQWIHFLNAGDMYCYSDSISKLLGNIDRPNSANVLYCEKIEGFKNIKNTFSLIYLVRFMINHQSVIYSRDLLLKNKFNDTYRIVGDYEQLLRMWKDIKPYPALLNGFVFYDKNGVSSNRENLVRIWSERARAIKASDLPIIWKMIAYTYARAALIYRKIIS